MTTKLTPSTPLFQQAIEALKVVQELPLSAYNISIDRVPLNCSSTGQPQVRYRLQRAKEWPDNHFVQLNTNNGSPSDMIITRAIQLKDWKGQSTIAVRWTLSGEWALSISEVGTIGDDEWMGAKNMEGVEHKAPAQATYDAVRAAIGQVAQRIHQRLSRVDLL